MQARGKVNQHGFTLIELVMVIVLIGLLSYGGVSLFTARSEYSNFVAKDLLISQALLAQQIALGSSGTPNPVSLTIANTGDAWRFALQKVGVTNPAPVNVESDGNSLQIDGATLGSGSSQTFTWTNGAVLSDGNNHVIRFSGETNFLVCLSSQGYAYEGNGGCP
ncbi:hypothetical protein A3742_16975 [Oleiphilus sp. HI0071]|jgi:prepilin-type N-terminal cleavage/methylation domain-containing protein|nr:MULTISPECIES: type II secretion system protein [unclassified Oleiphilus]KZY73359.1 hypothetical protein A3737_26940 [Oleiphilus sp. HI0065]KZY82746.1 hypothetical protein A3742_08695 [Oleiphilus sp. HI0071]KZZ05541.1 hypothetical protein A3744_08120 [Oleiphilus sp. HI0073]KZZ43055.1 hypothetical protein A3758_20605 [Oleiphilus sp. HI0118]KZZ50264.1 hypothetical protein A3760_20275 [Oleiphilus sp. HI0122]KZZ74865.1 hypothetical protein A3767_03485 [Oleiphilus sp. HI0133]KZZ77315.1 hypothet